MNDAKVLLWGSVIGAVSWLDDREIGIFQYAPDFVGSGIQVSPLVMPLNEFPYEFTTLPKNTFRGLPGLLADSLPDRFGNAVIDYETDFQIQLKIKATRFNKAQLQFLSKHPYFDELLPIELGQFGVNFVLK